MKKFKTLTEFEKRQFLLSSKRVLVGNGEFQELICYNRLLSYHQNKLNENSYKEILNLLWKNYHGVYLDYRKVEQGIINSLLTYYGSTPIDNIPKGSKGAFIGRKRDLYVRHIKKIFSDKGLVYESSKPEDADFYIFGDILKKKEMELNLDFSKPIISEAEVFNYYCDNYDDSKSDVINEVILESLIMRDNIEMKKLKFLSSMIKSYKPSALSDQLKMKLLVFYSKLRSEDGYDRSNKDHKDLYKNMCNIVSPHHKFFLEPKMLNSEYFLTVDLHIDASRSKATRDGELTEDSTLGYLGLKSWGNDLNYVIPISEECKSVSVDYLNSDYTISSRGGNYNKMLKDPENNNIKYKYSSSESSFGEVVNLEVVNRTQEGAYSSNKSNINIKYIISSITGHVTLVDCSFILYNSGNIDSANSLYDSNPYTYSFATRSNIQGYSSTCEEVQDKISEICDVFKNKPEIFKTDKDGNLDINVLESNLKLREYLIDNFINYYKVMAPDMGEEIAKTCIEFKK